MCLHAHDEQDTNGQADRGSAQQIQDSEWESSDRRVFRGWYWSDALRSVLHKRQTEDENSSSRLCRGFSAGLQRWFLAAELELKRLALAGRDNAEDQSAVHYLRKEFGGSPTEAVEAYRRQSVVSTLVPDGGNARFLKDTPVRIYIEPDLKWRVENWNQDVNGVPTAGKSTAQCFSLLRANGSPKVRLELVNPERKETNTVELTRGKFLTSG